MKAALEAAGLSGRSLTPGDVWTVDDADVSLTEPAGKSPRALHASRTVIIVDGIHRCRDASLTSVLVVPTSTRTDIRTPYRLTIPKEGGLATCSVLLDQIQPMPRRALNTHFGTISPETLASLVSIILSNLGVLPPPEGEEQHD